MPTEIFVNLPVRNLDKSMAFFKTLGFKFNKQFTDKSAACMVISDNIYSMLLTHQKFKSFTKKAIADTRKNTEVLTAISVDSKAKVNKIVEKAVASGAKEPRDPQDYGFMFLRAFEDLDGHTWEIFWMDPKAVKTS
jgi:hypothetical protein